MLARSTVTVSEHYVNRYYFGQEVKTKCPKSEEFLEIITQFIPKMCAVGAFEQKFGPPMD